MKYKLKDDETGEIKEYEVSYSQELQEQQLRSTNLLLIAVVILMILLFVGSVYAYLLVERLDQMNAVSQMLRCVL